MLKLVVLSCLMAAASASVVAGIAAPYFAYTAPWIAPSNYRGPLSLAPGQPANILGADGRPLDTLDVNLDRAAHYATKALSGVHILKKRSLAPIFTAPVGRIAYPGAPLIAHAGPVIPHIAPLSLATPHRFVTHAIY